MQLPPLSGTHWLLVSYVPTYSIYSKITSLDTFDSIFSAIHSTNQVIQGMLDKINQLDSVATNVAAVSEEQSASAQKILSASQLMVEESSHISINSEDVKILFSISDANDNFLFALAKGAQDFPSKNNINLTIADAQNIIKQQVDDIAAAKSQGYSAIICNNAEMALGVISALKEAGINPSSIPILGVDAIIDDCKAVQSGDMAFTVYQSASGQGSYSVEAAFALGSGEKISNIEYASDNGLFVWVPFESVDRKNVSQYISR